MAAWWREPDVEEAGSGGSAAARMWSAACEALRASDAERVYEQVAAASPDTDIWHSFPNCVDYQAGVWKRLVSHGVPAVVQPAAFELALVLRHTPVDLAVRLLAELLRHHPQSQDLTSYILALLTDDEASSYPTSPDGSPTPPGPAPRRDLQLFGDCELAVLAATARQYDNHARLVRNEYAQLSHTQFGELRIKVLNQLSKIPRLYCTAEFEPLEDAARENLEREISNLEQQLNDSKTS